ncbi:MAG: hypothetical protein WBD28_12225 [Candidatus Zixiibacteriota bacterium]
MTIKDEPGKVAVVFFVLTFLFSLAAGLAPSVAYAEVASDTFTHSVFAEFGTATW